MNTTKSNKDGQSFQMNGKSDGQVKEPKENSNNFNEKLNESSKPFEKGFGSANSNIMDMYNKQLQLMIEFYNNFFSPVIGNKDGSRSNGFTANFFNDDLTKVFSNPLNGQENPLLASCDKMYKQMLGYNSSFLAAFNSQANGNNIDWREVSKKYLETVKNRLEASKNVFNLLNEAYAGNIASSTAVNKKTIEEISNQLNAVIKQNQNFWTEMLEKYQSGDKTSKEPTLDESKKRANEPIIA
jgi:hypothetical protein